MIMCKGKCQRTGKIRGRENEKGIVDKTKEDKKREEISLQSSHKFKRRRQVLISMSHTVKISDVKIVKNKKEAV